MPDDKSGVQRGLTSLQQDVSGMQQVLASPVARRSHPVMYDLPNPAACRSHAIPLKLPVFKNGTLCH